MTDKKEVKGAGAPDVRKAAPATDLTAEEREARVVEQNEAAARSQVAPTVAGRTGVVGSGDDTIVLFGTGEYANTPLRQIPSWFLAHLMADAVDNLKWRQLTAEQQDAIRAERDRRAALVPDGVIPPPAPVSDLESPQERRAKAAAGVPVSSGSQAPTVPASESLASGTGTGTGEDIVPPAVPPPPGTAESTTKVPGEEVEAAETKVDPSTVGDLTVAEAKELIARTATRRQLNSIAAAENKRDGGARTGVTDAIDRRRTELENE